MKESNQRVRKPRRDSRERAAGISIAAVPETVPELSQIAINRHPTPTQVRTQKQAENSKFSACFILTGGLSKPPLIHRFFEGEWLASC